MLNGTRFNTSMESLNLYYNVHELNCNEWAWYERKKGDWLTAGNVYFMVVRKAYTVHI